MILNNLKEDTPCFDDKRILEQQIAEKEAQGICNQQMQKIKILANSKQLLQMDRAVQQLLLIPPNAPCAAEALQVSKEIGEHITQQSGQTYELLVKYQHIMDNHSLDDWFQFFSEKKLGR